MITDRERQLMLDAWEACCISFDQYDSIDNYREELEEWLAGDAAEGGISVEMVIDNAAREKHE